MIRELLTLSLLLPTTLWAEPISTQKPLSASEQYLRETVEGAAREAKEEARYALLLKEEKAEAPQVAKEETESSTARLIASLKEEVESLKDKVVVHSALTKATKSPISAKQISAKTLYTYTEGNVYDIRAMSDHITDIELEPGESLTELPASGDSSRWKIGVARSGSGAGEITHLIIRPIDEGIETNMLLTTNRRVYRLRLISADWYMPAVSWTYPEEDDRRLKEKIERENRIEPVAVNPESLQFTYQIEGDDVPWRPVRVFDDGEKTYIHMAPSMRVSEAPPLFVIEDGEPALVSYRMKDGTFIVDRLFSEAELRIGKKRVRITKEVRSRSLLSRIFG